MTTYIYFVRCPECEAEPFDFFDEAREFAMQRLTQKPVITQTEVNRNDFGECTDSCELGTVWSWEDMMGDAEDTPVGSVFSKADLKRTAGGTDPEFDDLDDSVDFNTVADAVNFLIRDEEEAIAGYEKAEAAIEDIGGKNKKELLSTINHIKAEEAEHIEELKATLDADALSEELADNMTLAEIVKDSINHLVNDLGKDSTTEDFVDEVIGDIERNYDTVVPNDMTKYFDWVTAVSCEVSKQLNGNDTIVISEDAGELDINKLVEEMEENEDNYECFYCSDTCAKERVHTTFDPETKKDVHVCPACYSELFHEASLEEAYSADEFTERLKNGIVLAKRGDDYFLYKNWADLAKDDALDPSPARSGGEANPFKYNDKRIHHIMQAVSYEAALRIADDIEFDDDITEAFDSKKTVDFDYDFTITVMGPKKAEDDWDEFDTDVSYTYTVPASDVATEIWETFITEEDVADVEGGFEALEDDAAWEAFLETHFDSLLNKYYDKLHKYYYDAAKEECESQADYNEIMQSEYDAAHEDDLRDSLDTAKKPNLCEWDETEPAKNSLLAMCPECGNTAFDNEAGVCVSCGFN